MSVCTCTSLLTNYLESALLRYGVYTQENGYTKEEMKVVWETLKIFELSADEVRVSCTAVRVPVLRAHSEAITIETVKAVTADAARYAAAVTCVLAVYIMQKNMSIARLRSVAYALPFVAPLRKLVCVRVPFCIICILSAELKHVHGLYRALLANAPGVRLADDPQRHLYPMPITATNSHDVEVGRVRESLVFAPFGLDLFVCGDQLLRGAALNAVLIAERIIAQKR